MTAEVTGAYALGEIEILPSGVSRQFVRHHDLNTNSGIEHVVNRTKLINSSVWLENMCIDETCGLLVSRSGTRFSFIKPVAPYTKYDLMPMIFPKKINEGLETHEIYDYSKEDQMIYWKIMVIGLSETKKLVPEDVRVFAVQNSNSFLSNGGHRGARSIKLIHFRILGFPEDEVEPRGGYDAGGNPYPLGVEEHLFKELGVLRQGGGRITRKIEEKMRDRLGDQDGGYKIIQRTAPPLGYSVFFDLPKSGRVDDPQFIKKIQMVMEANYRSYGEMCKSGELDEILGKDNVIFPQPSFRMYAVLHDNFLEIATSPIVISHAGPIEAAGNVLDRRKDPNATEPPERINFQYELTSKIISRL